MLKAANGYCTSVWSHGGGQHDKNMRSSQIVALISAAFLLLCIVFTALALKPVPNDELAQSDPYSTLAAVFFGLTPAPWFFRICCMPTPNIPDPPPKV